MSIASDLRGLVADELAQRMFAPPVQPVGEATVDAGPPTPARIIELFGVYKMPAVAYLSMALRHSIHHRGQLSSYARAMGGKVPAIYGPSADSVGT